MLEYKKLIENKKMSEPIQMSPHNNIEATIAVFASNELNIWDGERTLENIGNVALKLAVEAAPVMLHGFTPEDFRNFEANMSPEATNQIAYREKLMEGYRPFDDTVKRIKTDMADKPANQIEGYLASGAESNVFIATLEGKSYAIRLSKSATGGEGTAEAHIDGYVRSAFHGIGIPGLEQLAGLSYTEGATVGELLPGRTTDKMSSTEIAAIPEENLRKLATTLIASAQAKLSFDGNAGNMLYDPEAGFGLVDYGVRESEPDRARGLANGVTSSLFGTDVWLPSGRIPESEFVEDYDVLQGVLDDIIPTYDRWLEILKEEQVKQGLGDDYLTRVDELEKTSEKLKAAHQELGQLGAKESLVEAARTKREATVQAIVARIAVLEVGPKRIFPKGNIIVSRNDTF
jgi:hypothetical protein